MEQTETAVKILPFWGRITLVESPVDEEQHKSGLVLPHSVDEGVHRGVVQSVDQFHHEEVESITDLRPGTVVYYRAGTKILDVVVVNRSDILAYESE